MFFTENTGYTNENMLAKKICKSCMWVNECLTYALYNGVQGVWGGTTLAERDRIRKARNIKAEALPHI
jgi:hypothetical protein